MDREDSTLQSVTLDGDVTSVVFGEDKDGPMWNLLIRQDNVGGHTITGWPATLVIPHAGPLAPVINLAPDSLTLLTFYHTDEDDDLDILVGYVASQLGNDSGVPGTSIKDALDSLLASTAGTDSSKTIKLEPDDSGPSEVEVGNVTVLELPDGSVKGVNCYFSIPRDVDLSTDDPTVTFYFVISSTGGGNANIRLRTEARYVAAGEQIDKPIDETVLQTEAVVDVDEELHEINIVLDRTLMAIDDFVILNISRLGDADPPDTYSGNVGAILQQRFDYTRT